jgi:hypothetical protein
MMTVERETGIEPATNGLGSRYSTIELLPLQVPISLSTHSPGTPLGRKFSRNGTPLVHQRFLSLAFSMCYKPHIQLGKLAFYR